MKTKSMELCVFQSAERRSAEADFTWRWSIDARWRGDATGRLGGLGACSSHAPMSTSYCDVDQIIAELQLHDQQITLIDLKTLNTHSVVSSKSLIVCQTGYYAQFSTLQGRNQKFISWDWEHCFPRMIHSEPFLPVFRPFRLFLLAQRGLSNPVE